MGSLIKFARVALPLVLLLTAAIAVPMKLLDSSGLSRVERLRQELDNLDEINKQIEKENQALRAEIKSFHSDPSYIEKVARDELGMVGPDEVIYQFNDEKKQSN